MEEVVLLQGDEPSSVVLSFLNFLPILLVYSATTRYRAGEAAKGIFRLICWNASDLTAAWKCCGDSHSATLTKRNFAFGSRLSWSRVERKPGACRRCSAASCQALR